MLDDRIRRDDEERRFTDTELVQRPRNAVKPDAHRFSSDLFFTNPNLVFCFTNVKPKPPQAASQTETHNHYFFQNMASWAHA